MEELLKGGKNMKKTRKKMTKNIKILMFLGVFLAMAGVVYAYYDGQTLTQQQIDNYDTDISFGTLFDDLECEVIQNANRTTDEEGSIFYVYQVDCWDVVKEEGVYTIREKSHYVTLSLERWKVELRGSCGFPPDSECKEDFIKYTKQKIKKKFKLKIGSFLKKIDSWKTQDEPTNMSISF